MTIVDTDAAGLARTLAAVRASVPGAQVVAFEADVTHSASATRAVDHALDAHGALDVLVNNAAVRDPVTVEASTPEQWRAVIDVNLVAPSITAAPRCLRCAARAAPASSTCRRATP